MSRRHQHHDVGLLDQLIVVRQELLEHRQPQQPGEAAQILAIVLAQQAGEQHRLPFAQPSFVVTFRVPNVGADCPPTSIEPPSVLFSITSWSSITSPS